MAKRFVVGVTLRRAFDEKERSGQARPLLFVVLDELNKYAPRDGSRSEVERRVIANSAVRVVGRLDSAEAVREEYGFLPPTQRQRATIVKPGTMILSQPELPVPLVVQFPFPSWATRASEAAPPVPAGDPFDAWLGR